MEKICQVFEISRSAYYDWLKRPESKRKQDDKRLVEEIRRVHKESRETYGARRIKAQLNKDGFQCGKDKVSCLMIENNIHSKLKRKYKATTYSDHKLPVAQNILNQDFEAEKPSKK